MDIAKLRGMGILLDGKSIGFAEIRTNLATTIHPRLADVRGDVWFGKLNQSVYFFFYSYETKTYLVKEFTPEVLMDSDDFSLCFNLKSTGFFSNWNDLAEANPVKKIQWYPMKIQEWGN